jgi:hypothetical protein
MCEAERQLRKALHELDVQRGNGVIDLPKLRGILAAGCDCEKVGP